MNFSLAPDIEMIEYGNFCRIGQIDWLSLSQCTFTREKRRWKSHDLQKCNSKIDSFLGKFFTLTGKLYSLDICLYTVNPSPQTSKKKTLIHTTSQWICIQSLQSTSQKKTISIKLLPRVTISTVISAMMYRLYVVSGYSLMVGNIHMWSGQKHRSQVVREEKKLMMIKCDSCYTAIILSSINFLI